MAGTPINRRLYGGRRVDLAEHHDPATYTGAFTPIRDLYAKLPESRGRGYKPGRFSFNVKGGHCEACKGYGQKKVEMHFLADVWVKCRTCEGTRFNRQTLAVIYRQKNIADVLNMDVVILGGYGLFFCDAVSCLPANP